jgi:hypothetical protein
MHREVAFAAAAVFLLLLSGTASAAVDWDSLTADQLRAVPISEFQNVTWRQINAIPPQVRFLPFQHSAPFLRPFSIIFTLI